MCRKVFEGRRHDGAHRVWVRDERGSYLLSGPGRDLYGANAYHWGNPGAGTTRLALDLLCAVGAPEELAELLAPAVAVELLSDLGDAWTMHERQLTQWIVEDWCVGVMVSASDW